MASYAKFFSIGSGSDGNLELAGGFPLSSILQAVGDATGTDSPLQLSLTEVAIDGDLTINGELKNFVPSLQSGGAITITSANSDTFNTCVYSVTGAVPIEIDSSVPDGFSMTIYQTDANQCTIVPGGLTLRNSQGNSQTSGQFAVVSIIKIGTDLILTGDTA